MIFNSGNFFFEAACVVDVAVGFLITIGSAVGADGVADVFSEMRS